MGLRQLAMQDLNSILQDADTGFGWDIFLTNPAGVKLPFVGFSNDVGQMIDPETGIPISGRSGTFAVTMQALASAGFEFPVGIADSGLKPWIVDFNDIHGTPYTFKVSQSFPDRSLGLVVCRLEFYKI